MKMKTASGQTGDPGSVTEEDEARNDRGDVVVNVPNNQLTVVASRHQMALDDEKKGRREEEEEIEEEEVDEEAGKMVNGKGKMGSR